MNLPISPFTTAIAAANLAVNAAQQFSHSLGFDAILNEPARDDAPVASKPTLTEMKTAFGDSVRSVLSKLGLDANQGMKIGVQWGDRITFDSDHPQAAGYEAALNEDVDLRLQAERLFESAGQTPLQIEVPPAIDLTPGALTGNIIARPGGYANWLAD